MKKSLSIFLVLITVFSSVMLFSASAQNPEYAAGITDEMCRPSYWYDKGCCDAEKVLMTPDEIAAVNQAAIDGVGTNVFDIYNLSETYDASKQKKSLANIDIPTRALYINGELINNNEFFTGIIDAVKETGYDGTARTQYAVCTKRADMKAYPVEDRIAYSTVDYDDEYESTGLCINEPFVIRQKCDFGGETFYWGYARNCTGWINSKSLAICESKDQWLDAVDTDLDAKDFLVVTQDKIITEIAVDVPEISEVKLTFGTILKLVPDDEIPESIGERSAWNNYIVYLPVRDENGAYMKQPALIPQHCDVSIGFLPFTQKNLLDVAFNCLGNRYGWAGVYDSMDCSLYLRNIYRCFGFEIPRNTTWQQKVPGTLINLSDMNDEQKQHFIETLSIGTMLYFSGHAMMYIGSENSTGYVISDLGTVIDSVGEMDIRGVYSVTINPLTVRRGNGYSWLRNLSGAVAVIPAADIGGCTVSAVKDENGIITVEVSNGGSELYEGVNYTVDYSGDTVTITGINNFTGTVETDITEPSKPDEPQKICFFQKIINFFKKIFDYIVSFF